MKKTIMLMAITSLSFALHSQAQIMDRFKQKVKDKANNKVDQKLDNAADKVVNAPETAANNTDKNNGSNTQSANNNSRGSTSASTTKSGGGSGSLKDYGKYDFVPGDTVLFEDNVQDEQNDEIPSKWKIVAGRVETRIVGDEKAIMMVDGWAATITPRLKLNKNVLPQRYTLEFDLMYQGIDIYGSNWATEVKFANGTGSFTGPLQLYPAGTVNFAGANGTYPNPDEIGNGKWFHVAIAVTEKSMKVYQNSFRVLNAQIDGGGAASFILNSFAGIATDNNKYFKNVRLAAGGIDPYKQINTTGSFIARGIKFDYTKATLRPESMGEINRIYALMKDHGDLKFEIGGHTDSDGDDTYNTKLSQQRADAVKAELVAKGIDGGRLTTKGYGKNKPVTSNSTPEGKANNRRVEFTKK